MLLRKINTALPVRQGGLWDVYRRIPMSRIGGARCPSASAQFIAVSVEYLAETITAYR